MAEAEVFHLPHIQSQYVRPSHGTFCTQFLGAHRDQLPTCTFGPRQCRQKGEAFLLTVGAFLASMSFFACSLFWVFRDIM